MLRQHDILLKRQFFNIQDSIQSLQKPKAAAASATTTTTTTTSASSLRPTDNLTTTNTNTTNNNNNNNDDDKNGNSNTNTTSSLPNGSSVSVLEETEAEVSGRLVQEGRGGPDSAGRTPRGSVSNSSKDDFPLETYVVRPSSSVTMLHEDSEEEEDADTFAEEFFCRPRTSSMRTSRDMAALARRRGSKELI